MAKVDLNTPFGGVHGKVDKQARMIMRQKTYRAPTGAVLKQGVQESYTVTNPRDFHKNPPKGNEASNMRAFGNISLQVSEIIRSGKYTDAQLADMPDEQRAHVIELRQQLESYRERFYAQFKRPDNEAPFEKKPQPGSSKLRRLQYVKLDTFIQAILRQKSINNK